MKVNYIYKIDIEAFYVRYDIMSKILFISLRYCFMA